MGLIRTPEERFANLPDYPFKENYLEINGAQVHYVDQGSGKPVLCLHGEPTWSFLYRKMIPFLSKDQRVIAPDLIGFGKSDKYTRLDEYSFEMHRDTVRTLIEKLDLNDITLVCQDWGGLIGLRVVTMIPERFSRIVIMNTGIPVAEEKLPIVFKIVSCYLRVFNSAPSIVPLMRFGMLPVRKKDHGILKKLLIDAWQIPKDVIQGYNAPFPDSQYKAGMISLPLMLPVHSTNPVNDEMKKTREGLKKWNKPALVMFSDGDPFTRGWDKWFRDIIPTAKNESSIVIKDAGHFLQETKGRELAMNINDFIKRT